MATKKTNKPQKAAEKAINTALDAAEEINAKSVETVDTALATSEKAIKDSMKQAEGYAKNQSVAFESGYAQAATMASDNLDVAFKAAKEATNGWNAYTQQIMDYTKKAFAENMVVAEKFAAAKTPEEFMNLNGEVAKKATDRVSGQATKLNDIAQATAAKVGEPIKAQVEKNIETLAR